MATFLLSCFEICLCRLPLGRMVVETGQSSHNSYRVCEDGGIGTFRNSTFERCSKVSLLGRARRYYSHDNLQKHAQKSMHII